MKQIYYISFTLVCAFFLACSSDKEVQTVELESLLPQSQERENVQDTLPAQQVELDTFSAAWLTLIPDLTLVEDKEAVSYFPDRFNYLVRHQLIGELDHQYYFLTMWQFKDSLQLMSAFYNWLDCFGPDCKSLKVGEELRIDRDQAIAVWVGENKLIYLTSTALIKQVFWQDLINEYAKNEWDFHFVQQKKRNTEWFLPSKEE